MHLFYTEELSIHHKILLFIHSTQTKRLITIPCVILLIVGLTTLLYGIYHLLQMNVRTNQRLRKLALFDSLTHLPNRKFLFQECVYDEDKLCVNGHEPCEIKRNIFHSDKAAILFIDIDDFKLFNDYAGHTAGDRVLKVFAERLRTLAYKEDIVIRLSGDEFVIVYNCLPNKETIESFVKKITSKINEPILLNDRKIFIHCSIGIALYPKHGTDMEILLKKADIAMYESKRYGKNQYYIFEDKMEIIFNQKFELTHELRNAVNHKHFVVHYQKIANTQTGETTRLEALVRWNHPVKGLLPPSDFISLAEEILIIDEIDKFVLETVCQQIQRWQQENKKPYPISVNISPTFFMQLDFTKVVQRLINQYKIDPSYIQLEITETVALHDFERTKETLDKLKAIGVNIFIDNFGKDYSSFNYVKAFRFDTIKIDKSFINGIDQNTIDATLIKHITELAKTLNFTVISEGVETQKQLEFLKEIGCDEYQGYILNKPVPIEELHLTFEPLNNH